MIEAAVLGKDQDSSLGHYLKEWLAHARGRVRATTYAGYESLIRCYVLPALGEVRVSELSPLLIQRLYSSLLVPERRLSAGTVLNLHLVLTQALGQAVRWGILERNPVRGRNLRGPTSSWSSAPRFISVPGRGDLGTGPREQDQPLGNPPKSSPSCRHGSEVCGGGRARGDSGRPATSPGESARTDREILRIRMTPHVTLQGSASVRLVHRNGQLAFEIEDDGVGFDAASMPRGAGLQNMADRLAALDGTFEVRSNRTEQPFPGYRG